MDQKRNEGGSLVPDLKNTEYVETDSQASQNYADSMELTSLSTKSGPITPKPKSVDIRCLSHVTVREAQDDSDDCDCDDDNSADTKCLDESTEKVGRLMELLDKKKNVLSNMVQCETVEAVHTQKVVGAEKIREDLPLENERTSEKLEQLPDISSQIPVLELICDSVSDWITEGSLNYLRLIGHGEQSEDSEFKSKYEEMCKHFDIKAYNFSKLMKEDIDESSKSVKKTLPNFEKLEELNHYDIKVQEFFKGRYTYKVKDEGNNVADVS